jgi:hypothetical protein
VLPEPHIAPSYPLRHPTQTKRPSRSPVPWRGVAHRAPCPHHRSDRHPQPRRHQTSVTPAPCLLLTNYLIRAIIGVVECHHRLPSLPATPTIQTICPFSKKQGSPALSNKPHAPLQDHPGTQFFPSRNPSPRLRSIRIFYTFAIATFAPPCRNASPPYTIGIHERTSGTR